MSVQSRLHYLAETWHMTRMTPQARLEIPRNTPEHEVEQLRQENIAMIYETAFCSADEAEPSIKFRDIGQHADKELNWYNSKVSQASKFPFAGEITYAELKKYEESLTQEDTAKLQHARAAFREKAGLSEIAIEPA